LSRRKATELRQRVESASDAPRYLSITEFAKRHDVTTQQLNRWMRTGSVWVPTPAVVLGEIERPGWEKEVVESWERGALGVERPKAQRYLNVAQMCERWHVTPDTLWACIGEDQTAREPDMWLVHGLKTDPGWLPAK
jgi:hypothetical protein